MMRGKSLNTHGVIPAKAGISLGIPAFAGMTPGIGWQS